MIIRSFQTELLKRIQEDRPLIQVLLGPRQVGKTTAVKSIIKQYGQRAIYISADGKNPLDQNWITMQFQNALQLGPETLLVIDEIQKIQQWQEQIKALWDRDPFRIKIILTGSSSLNLVSGLSESMAGRYEVMFAYHWNFIESEQLADLSLEEFLRYGGYPASYRYTNDLERFESYLQLSILDNVILKDILAFRQVKSPALFRQTFEIICSFPAQEISYNKLLGQIQQRGNIDLVKHYLELFEAALLIKVIFKYSIKKLVKKGSSPKIILLAPVLYELFRHPGEEDKTNWNFESTVGAALVKLKGAQLYYWREGNYEVDFVVTYRKQLYAIEVKSGRKKSPKGILKFQEKYPHAKALFVTREDYRSFIADTQKFFI